MRSTRRQITSALLVAGLLLLLALSTCENLRWMREHFRPAEVERPAR